MGSIQAESSGAKHEEAAELALGGLSFFRLIWLLAGIWLFGVFD
jgi:hypothetical protein